MMTYTPVVCEITVPMVFAAYATATTQQHSRATTTKAIATAGFLLICCCEVSNKKANDPFSHVLSYLAVVSRVGRDSWTITTKSFFLNLPAALDLLQAKSRFKRSKKFSVYFGFVTVFHPFFLLLLFLVSKLRKSQKWTHSIKKSAWHL